MKSVETIKTMGALEADWILLFIMRFPGVNRVEYNDFGVMCLGVKVTRYYLVIVNLP